MSVCQNRKSVTNPRQKPKKRHRTVFLLHLCLVCFGHLGSLLSIQRLKRHDVVVRFVFSLSVSASNSVTYKKAGRAELLFVFAAETESEMRRDVSGLVNQVQSFSTATIDNQ